MKHYNESDKSDAALDDSIVKAMWGFEWNKSAQSFRTEGASYDYEAMKKNLLKEVKKDLDI